MSKADRARVTADKCSLPQYESSTDFVRHAPGAEEHREGSTAVAGVRQRQHDCDDGAGEVTMGRAKFVETEAGQIFRSELRALVVDQLRQGPR
ncbi:hypothetical protein [Nocardia farcinica]|uniref:hypothetical protein n=1 Tax=Nocardia farcinica TaxID=37329 RepID=UPI001145D85F|nr:hypothetical protein [Nocardia farcinica]